MGKSSSEGLIPEVINNFNVYNGDAKKMLGISEEIQLPEFTAITSEIKGAGILGAIRQLSLAIMKIRTLRFRTKPSHRI